MSFLPSEESEANSACKRVTSWTLLSRMWHFSKIDLLGGAKGGATYSKERALFNQLLGRMFAQKLIEMATDASQVPFLIHRAHGSIKQRAEVFPKYSQ